MVAHAFRENTGEGALNLDNLRSARRLPMWSPAVRDSRRPSIPVSKSDRDEWRERHFQRERQRHAAAQLSMAVHPDMRYRGSRRQPSGAVSSNLTLTGVTFAQAGFYAVVVTNAAGSTISDPVALSVWRASAPAFSYLTYNVHGNGLTNWSTNMWHVQAIGRQMQYLDPDIITFNEIPVTNNCTAQMADFVMAWRPGYYLVTNSADNGYIPV